MTVALCLLSLSFILRLGWASAEPVMLLGPTADLETPEVIRQLLDLVDNDGVETWPTTFSHVKDSGGALHIRQMIFGGMTDTNQKNLAHATLHLGLNVSIESGGALCANERNGTTAGTQAVKSVDAFIQAGGRFKYLGLESIFSRTHVSCPSQTHSQTAFEVASFAAAISAGFAAANSAPPKFFLYDALPHMSVGKWPANVQSYGMDLGQLLQLLVPAMTAKNTSLAGYWIDCPFEYSRDYPNATSPLPAGSGFQKVAAAVTLVKGMGLQVGKTFNSQEGGATSDRLFYTSTLADWEGAKKAGATFDYVMVETWYPHPSNAAPETQPYTTTYTAKAVFDEANSL